MRAVGQTGIVDPASTIFAVLTDAMMSVNKLTKMMAAASVYNSSFCSCAFAIAIYAAAASSVDPCEGEEFT